jgi:hypothetical protein
MIYLGMIMVECGFGLRRWRVSCLLVAIYIVSLNR